MGVFQVEEVIKTMLPLLDEKQRRLFLASCANSIGRGGLKQVCEISGASKNTIIKGQRELKHGIGEEDNRIRKSGGGRKKSREINPKLPEWIDALVMAETYGNPENPLLWTTKTLRKIQEAILVEHQIYVSHSTVAVILTELGYSLQSNQKMLQKGEPHPDRNAQFEHINTTAKKFLEDGQPVISVDTKKKENIGNFKNNGQEYRKTKDPRKVLDHDFPIKELGKVAPYGVYVLNDNTAFVNLGLSHDTAEFAVDTNLQSM